MLCVNKFSSYVSHCVAVEYYMHILALFDNYFHLLVFSVHIHLIKKILLTQLELPLGLYFCCFFIVHLNTWHEKNWNTLLKYSNKIYIIFDRVHAIFKTLPSRPNCGLVIGKLLVWFQKSTSHNWTWECTTGLGVTVLTTMSPCTAYWKFTMYTVHM